MSASLPRSSPPSPAESLSSISPTAVIPELWLRPARSHPPPWPWWRGFTPCARNFNLCIRLNASSALPGRSVRPVCWSGVVRRGWNASGLFGSRWRTVIFRRFPFPTPAIPSLRPAKRSRAPHPPKSKAAGDVLSSFHLVKKTFRPSLFPWSGQKDLFQPCARRPGPRSPLQYGNTPWPGQLSGPGGALTESILPDLFEMRL